MDPSSHPAASSSLNGHAAELYPDASESHNAPAFPSLTPLSHDLALLSPTQTPTFSVDDFLLSRTKASDLNFILSDLRTYSEKLKHELYSIINEDYKDFVSLGSSLKAEAHRIARLGWNVRSTGADGDGVAPHGLMAPVRDTLLASRSMLKSVERDIQDCIKRKEDATAQKAKLELMLQLHDSIVTLEDLLLLHHDKARKDRRRSSHAAARRPSVLSITSVRERRGSLASIASGSDQEVSDYAMSSEYDEDSDSDDDDDDDEASDDQLAAAAGQSNLNGDGQQRRTRRRILRRLSSSTHNPRSPIQTRDSASPTKARSDTFTSTATSSSTSLLGLPQRIARTSAEYSRLRFLHRRIDQENLTHYADALQDRIDTIRSVLRQDLRTLLSYLVSPDSLLVHGQTSAREPSSPELRKSAGLPAVGVHARRSSFLRGNVAAGAIREEERSELDAWSQVAEPAELDAAYWQARVDEQRAWLEMALGTLNTLTLVKQAEGAEPVKRRNEAEEAVRDLLVAEWAAKTIVVVDKDQHANGVNDSKKDLPQAAQALFEEHRQHVASLLLTSDSPTPLLELYNTLLTFVATTAWHVCDAAREISRQSTVSPTPPTIVNTTDAVRCDIFTHVIWDTLSSHLLTTCGTTIFFVGHTDTFYTNYTLTNAFLQRLLSLAPSEESRRATQDHANWHAFRRRWQLPVYFQMRLREVVTRLEAELADGAGRSEGGLMSATRATLEAVERVWSDGVHVHELSAREWRVTLQLLSRYKTWVEEQSGEFANLAASGSVRQLDAVRSGDASRTSMDRPASSDVSRVSTPQPAAADATAQQREDEQLQFAATLLSDCFALRERMEAMLVEIVIPRIAAHVELDSGEAPAGLAELRADLAQVLCETLDFIPGLSASVGRLVYTVVLPRVAAPLRLLRSFSTRAYRASSSAAAGVQVIQQLFAPLQAILRLDSVHTLPVDLKRSWAQSILADAFKRYTATIDTVSKNQLSLIRLKKAQNPSSATSAGLLGGLFKSATPASGTTAAAGETVAELERAFVETNRQARAAFEAKLDELDLHIDLDGWSAWLALRAFLESDLDQL